MRGFLKTSGRWLSGGWIWPLVLLALPACAFQTNGIKVPGVFDPGDQPLTSAVMCDIPKPQDSGKSYRCATATDVGVGLLDTTAAVSLADGTNKNAVLDQSADAINECGPLGRVTEYIDPFPTGTPVCLNCMQQIPAKYKGPDDVCAAKCVELLDDEEMDPIGGSVAYCNANAHASTNFKPNVCFTNACTAGGQPIVFADPRRNAEPVEWSTGIGEDIGVMVNGNTVTQTAATPPDTGTFADFQAGAAATQIITQGDAWVEFEANDNTVSQVLGVHPSSCAKAADCPDADPSLNDIGFAIILNKDQHFYTIESSPMVATSPQAYGTYLAHDRFRLHITDNHDGTAKITYSKLTAACVPGMSCSANEMFFGQQVGPNPKYPLRIDASFREQGGTLANVLVMRIIQ